MLAWNRCTLSGRHAAGLLLRMLAWNPCLLSGRHLPGGALDMCLDGCCRRCCDGVLVRFRFESLHVPRTLLLGWDHSLPPGRHGALILLLGGPGAALLLRMLAWNRCVLSGRHGA